MRLLVAHGLVRPSRSVLDYGCGQGDDVRALSDAGIEAAGWDPHFCPDVEKRSSDVVNLGFVINVIEDLHERASALREAWQLTKSVLSVATMLVGQSSTAGLIALADGYLTSRGTFQKYYLHGELREYLTECLGVSPVPVAPGIFFVFRDAAEQAEFVFERRRSRTDIHGTFRVPARVATDLASKTPGATREIADFILVHGRTPSGPELSMTSKAELRQARVSLARATNVVLDTVLDISRLEEARRARIEDLLVHAALERLEHGRPATLTGVALALDVKAHFGGRKALEIASEEYLRSLREVDILRSAFAEVADRGMGLLDGKGRLLVAGERMDEMPGLLRCYFGCAASLSGVPPTSFLTRMDARSKRISMWQLENAEQTFPTTETRLLVDLRRASVDVFPDRRRVLCMGKLRGLPEDSRQRLLEAGFVAKHPSLEGQLLFRQ